MKYIFWVDGGIHTRKRGNTYESCTQHFPVFGVNTPINQKNITNVYKYNDSLIPSIFGVHTPINQNHNDF